MDTLLVFPFMASLVALYFVPALIAGCRHHQQGLAIAVLNVCLGWTLLGWVGALVWACTEVRPPAVRPEPMLAPTPLFPRTPRLVRRPMATR